MFSQGYLIDTQLCIAALWLFYIAVLHRRTGLQAARIFLLSLVPVGMLLPFIRIPLLPAEPLPLRTMPQNIVTDAPTIQPEATLSEVLTWGYAAGTVLALAFTLGSVLRTWIRVRKTRDSRIVFSPDVAGAYSVFGTVFINDKYEGSPMLGQILAHEKSHIARRHSLDLVWMRLCGSLLWFNPLVWHCTKLLREVHEYQADRDVIRQGNPVMPYIDLLLDTEAGIYPGAANAFCYSLTKKRLLMIAKATHRTSIGGYLRLAALPGLIGAMLCAFSLTTKAAEIVPAPLTPTSPKETAKVDTIDLDIRPIAAPKLYADGKKVDTLRHVNIDVQPIQPKNTVQKSQGRYAAQTVRGISPMISLRGIGDSVSHPIYVIDGIIIDAGKQNHLDAADYQSITVLKGKAATSLYGEKGKDGAIVITTKKSVQPKNITISNSEIRLGQSSTAGRAGYSDAESVKQVTVSLSKKEKRKGVTVSNKLLENYPELFELSPDGKSVKNRIPVSVTINEEQ